MSAPRLTLLSRQWCHLCHDMLDALRPLADAQGVEVEVLDVDADEALEARWGEWVPVLLADGEEICHYHLDEAALRAYFERFAQSAAFPLKSAP